MSQNRDRRQRSKKQEQLAHACPLTVIADSVYYLHEPRIIQRLVAEQLGLSERPADIRFDLLAVPDLLGQAKSTTTVELLANDVATAIGLHGSEMLAVIGENEAPEKLAETLERHPLLRDQLAKTVACAIRRPALTPWSGQAVIGCMDWRLHGRGDLSARARFAFGDSHTVIDTVTVPGVAKDLETDGPRFETVASWLKTLCRRGLRRLYLVGHEDCGKYGGHTAFPGRDEENRVLADDLFFAADRLRHCLPQDLYIGLGIAELSGDNTVSRIRRLKRRPR